VVRTQDVCQDAHISSKFFWVDEQVDDYSPQFFFFVSEDRPGVPDKYFEECFSGTSLNHLEYPSEDRPANSLILKYIRPRMSTYQSLEEVRSIIEVESTGL
jgi:hypothetical protein